ncbi:HamA C-terminal domain-containing protein [Cohnella fermenti]|uniref:DUF1837 domain-containing protein n=1 Tax=Cohnella fermenti TaxID=2565925 RepID=A0A4S4C8X5_9BACL|nr:DUF1837 domain-containing protein [Cohnella fermenti]THF84444.1 DUF1837 domain-containing protein [Cohnella fermenti]
MSMTYFESHLVFDEYISKTHLRGFSVGYELNEYRYDSIVELIFNALPDFALSHSELATLGSNNCVRKMKKAAKLVYESDKYTRRGEFGEVLLHIVMRDYFNTIPAISKLYYKDSSNDTVKGFDAVHIVPIKDELELWLGEVKFYNNCSTAIRDVIKELWVHTDKDFLRKEFLFVSNKIDASWPHASQLQTLIDDRTSLDKIFSRLKIPVLLTYDSDVIKKHRVVTDTFKDELITELEANHQLFRNGGLPTTVEFVLILIPLEEKKILVDQLHQELRGWQR